MNRSAILGFSYFIGLILASFLPDFVCISAFVLLFLLGAFSIKRFKSLALSFLALSLAFGVGYIYTNYKNNIRNLAGSEIYFSHAEVLDIKSVGNDTALFTLKGEANGRVIKFTMFSQDIDVNKGDTISFKAKLSPLVDNALFSQSTYYSSRNIFLKANAASEINIQSRAEKNFSTLVDKYSRYIENTITENLTAKEGDFLAATFLGKTNLLDDELKNSIKRTGLAHYLAVSGMHLSFTGTLLMLFLNATSVKSRRILKFSLLSATVLFFMLFYGFSVSVMRSGFMLIIFYGADLFRRKSSAINSIGLALLMIILPSPYAAFDIGLHLSILGTFGVAVVGDYWNKWLNKRFNLKKFKSLVEVAVGTLAANICTFPVILLAFKGISTVSILTNMIATPIFNIALICLIIHTITFGVFSGPLLLIAGLCAKLIILSIVIIDKIPYSYIVINNDILIFVVLISFLFVIVSAIAFKRRVFIFSSALISCVLISFTVVFANSSGGVLLNVLSDGKAGAIIIDDDKSIYTFVMGNSPNLANVLKEYFQNNNVKQAMLLSLPQVDSAYAKLYGELTDSVKFDTIIINDNIISSGLDFAFKGENVIDANVFSFGEGIIYGKIAADRTILNINDNHLLISSVKNMDKADNKDEFDIAIYMDYKKSSFEGEGKINIFVNSRQSTVGENDFNAYQEEISLIIDRNDENSRVLKRRNYAFY